MHVYDKYLDNVMEILFKEKCITLNFTKNTLCIYFLYIVSFYLVTLYIYIYSHILITSRKRSIYLWLNS
jgi:hypothetical protein